MKKALVNVIKGIIKFPLFFFYFFLIPLMLLSELEDLGSGKLWRNNGFFFQLMCKLDEFMNKIYCW